MRLLLIIPGLDAGGGTERSLLELVPTLVASGMDVSVAYLKQRDPAGEDVFRRGGARLHHVPATRLPTRVRGLRRVIASERPDIVHTSLYEADLAGRLAAGTRRGRAPVVLSSIVNTSYDPVRLADPNVRAWKLRAVRLLDGWTARHYTDYFHAVSQAVKDSAVRALRIDADRVTVIERGRDPNRLGRRTPRRRARARAALGLMRADRVIVAVGRQEFQKGHVHLVEAFESVASRHRDARLVLVGRSGSQTADLEARIDHSSARDRIQVLGHRDDVPELLAAADLFALPSLYEGFPGAVVEAMALELPVVASRLPSLDELVEDGRSGILVPAGDAGRLATAIGSLLEDPESSQRLGNRGREQYLERFTAQASQRRMVRLYRDLVPT